MEKNQRPVRIAFPDPSKERKLTEPFQRAVARTGFSMTPSPDNENIMQVTDTQGEIAPFELIYVRTEDAPVYMENGAVDLAVLGRNVLDEYNCAAKLQGRALAAAARNDLNFSACRLVMAVPSERREEAALAADLLKFAEPGRERVRIATSYPATVAAWMEEQGVPASSFEIVRLSGGVEKAVAMGLADIICDITQTGSSLKKNNLAEVFQLAEDSAAVIAVRRDSSAPEIAKIAERIGAACAELFNGRAVPIGEIDLPAPFIMAPQSLAPAAIPVNG